MAQSLGLEPILDILLSDAQRDVLGFDRRLFAAKSQALHRLAVVYVTNVLSELNLFSVRGERRHVRELIDQCRIASRHEKLLRRWLSMLSDERLLARDDETFVSIEPLRSQSTDELLRLGLEQWPEAPELVNCMKCCGENLRAILIGEKSALECLFPAGSFRVAEAIYERSAPWRYCNDLLASAMRVVADGWDRPRPLRVLEVGAGVGGTTKPLLEVLAGSDAEYVFTDVSRLFLAKANKKFADYRGLRREILDLEKELEPQGFYARSFDVIVAANVLHATTDIETTVQRVHSLLRPGGLLLLMELTENQTWLDMIFALLDGWGRHSDRIRTDRPTLSIPQWQMLLTDAGFCSVYHFPVDVRDAEAISNTVFVVKAGSDERAFS